MAYRNFDPDPCIVMDPCPGVAITGHATFTLVEWTVIRLARNERAAGLRASSCIVRQLRALFGFEATQPLADPRLEVLRQTAIALWHAAPEIDAGTREALIDAGYTAAQLAMLERYVAAAPRR